MSKKEAKSILTVELARYRERSYADLQRLLHSQDTFEIRADSGVAYQLEFYAAWDNHPNGSLRVFGCIDDGGIRAFCPLSRCFILAPDGTFVGEDDAGV